MSAAASLNSSTTALQALQGADLTGKTAIVTGSNSGIGKETVRALATAGARVILTSRTLPAGEEAAQELKRAGVKGDIVVKQLDIADLASVQRFAQDFLASERGPHLLILNAGVMACPLGYTKHGFEMQIGTNHFGHFALTRELLPSMRRLGVPARVVAVSSNGHRWGDVDLEDLHWKKRKYNPWAAYGASKTANILFAKELARRESEAGSNIKAYSLHPGVIMTNLGRHQWGSGWGKWAVNKLGYFFFKTPEQGAATTVTAAVSPDLEQHSGAYLSDCQVTKPLKPQAEDIDFAKKFWAVTEEQLAQAQAKK